MEELILSRYRLGQPTVARLAGRAFEGQDTSEQGSPVEVHLLPAEGIDETAVMTASREVDALASVRDASIARPLAVVWQPESVVVVAERVEGRPLDDAIAQGPLPPRQAVEVIRSVLHALSLAHRAGAAHGGLSPRSIVLKQDGQAC